uniref:Putative secreted protein n=1 Tax=Anopheles darlingi TaxID=43151 RepID=A0A2M4DEU6_ANODA
MLHTKYRCTVMLRFYRVAIISLFLSRSLSFTHIQILYYFPLATSIQLAHTASRLCRSLRFVAVFQEVPTLRHAAAVGKTQHSTRHPYVLALLPLRAL